MYTILVLAFSSICIIERIKGTEVDCNTFIYVLFLYSFLVFLLALSCINKPKAIDAYRGKTTLEITYKDKMPVDSIVVWK